MKIRWRLIATTEWQIDTLDTLIWNPSEALMAGKARLSSEELKEMVDTMKEYGQELLVDHDRPEDTVEWELVDDDT